MIKGKKFKTIEEYYASLSIDFRDKLNKIRQLVKKEAPEAEEVLSYQMPAFKLNKKILIYYAIWKEHIALYSFLSSVKEFKKELSHYQTSKGTIKFLLDKPIPLNLIRKIIKYRIKENFEKKADKNKI